MFFFKSINTGAIYFCWIRLDLNTDLILSLEGVLSPSGGEGRGRAWILFTFSSAVTTDT
jgi:hypothetical protein